MCASPVFRPRRTQAKDPPSKHGCSQLLRVWETPDPDGSTPVATFLKLSLLNVYAIWLFPSSVTRFFCSFIPTLLLLLLQRLQVETLLYDMLRSELFSVSRSSTALPSANLRKQLDGPDECLQEPCKHIDGEKGNATHVVAT